MVRMLCSADDRPQPPLGDRRRHDDIRHGQDLFPVFRGKAQKRHDLSYPGTGYPFSASDLGLVRDLAGIELPLPFDRLSEQFGHPGGLWSRRLENGAGRGDDVHTLVGLDSSRQDAYIDGAEGDLDFLFAVGLPGGAIFSRHGRVDDSEPDLGSHGARPVRRAGRAIVYGFVTP